MKLGDTGHNVEELQELLNDNGIVVAVDGDYGPKTVEAVKQFQQREGLAVDGVAGNKTLEKLSKTHPVAAVTSNAIFDAASQVPERFKVKIVAVRDYKKSDGNNKVGVYDDAVMVLWPGGSKLFKSNSDPSRLGWNPGVGKPFAQLTTGLHYFVRGYHKGKYPAFRQPDPSDSDQVKILINSGLTAADCRFKVLRTYGVGDPRNYYETGYFAINIHKGSEYGTSSWGCQTFDPADWNQFKELTYKLMDQYGQSVLPYLLIQGPVV